MKFQIPKLGKVKRQASEPLLMLIGFLVVVGLIIWASYQ